MLSKICEHGGPPPGRKHSTYKTGEKLNVDKGRGRNISKSKYAKRFCIWYTLVGRGGFSARSSKAGKEKVIYLTNCGTKKQTNKQTNHKAKRQISSLGKSHFNTYGKEMLTHYYYINLQSFHRLRKRRLENKQLK